MLDSSAAYPTSEAADYSLGHPPLVSLPDEATTPPPFSRLFSAMFAPLTRNFNLLPDVDLRLFSDELGENLRLSAPALVDVMVDMAPSLDQVVTLAPGTAFATASSESDNPVVFSTLAERSLLSASLATAGTLASDADVKDPATASRLAPLAPGLAVADNQCVLFVLSRPLPGMTCLVTLPTDIRDSAWMRWEAWQGNRWVPCSPSGGAGLAAAPRSAEFAVPLPAAHSAFPFPATATNPPVAGAGLLRCSAPSSFTLQAEAGVRCRGVVTAVQGELVPDEILGTSDGAPAQKFPLRQRISTAYARPWIESVQDTRVERWTMVDSFAASGPADRHFMINPATGQVMFSPDLKRGGTPPPGAALRILLYHSGGGAAGNVPAGSVCILQIPRPEITGIFNPRAGIGGTDPRYTGRPSAAINHPILLAGTAVTAQECEDLALSTGLGIARAWCVPAAAGDRTLVNLHVLPTAQPDTIGRLTKAQLTISKDTADAIRSELSPRLAVGVGINPTDFPLQDVTTTVTVRARQWASPQERKTLAQDTCTALHHYFSPLPGQGPSGDGWPLGQQPDTSDIHRALAGVPNLDSVADFPPPTLTVSDPTEPGSLVYSSHHTITCLTFDGQSDADATFRS
ncbi:hypothetical protein [Streptomyces noursei]|uniref:Baseplate protein J-like domain-containing protein n=1 Tax=Streptomyces noursei TaxID=1971 RepID=A0A2N8PFQ0_STRNR|nr:hypothetical protein [Streptomyces noursei]PNE39848.1 hypothetical protein AOB60_01495 [Streptomyces noursei]